MPDLLCANTLYPECKHPHRHHDKGSNERLCRWPCLCTEFVAPADTVSVTVQVPKPPEGYEPWEQTEEAVSVKDPTLVQVIYLRSRRKPEPPLVPVMLTWADRAHWASLTAGIGSEARQRLTQACRDAEASAQVCGKPVAVEDTGYPYMAKCQQPTSHTGRCSPEKSMCGVDFWTDKRDVLLRCRLSDGHDGMHKGRP